MAVPIYEGETAVLPMALLPMQQAQRRPEQVRVFVGKPAVAMDGTRSQEGDVDYDPKVLRQVVIPNPITVHLGAPPM